MKTLSIQRFSMSALSCACAAVLLTACGGGGSGDIAPEAQSSLSGGAEVVHSVDTAVASAASTQGAAASAGEDVFSPADDNAAVAHDKELATDANTTPAATAATAPVAAPTASNNTSAAPASPTAPATTAPATTTPAAPATADAWTRCADEYGTCSFSGTRQVRYGLNDKWAYQTASGSIQCNNTIFGDPSPGANKVCEYSGAAPTEPATTSTNPAPYGQSASAYTLTFQDEFNSGFNTNVWNDKIWYETGNATKNYTVEDGKLKIWPQRDASGNFFNRTIDTDGKYYQTYGYFEIDAKLPVGMGTWPAFWLFNHIGNRRPEMDVMEAYAGGAAPWGFTDANGIPHPQAYAPTVWKGDYEGQLVGSRQYDTGMDLSAGFHKYAVKWEPNKQTYYFDGKEVLTLNTTFSDPMYLMLDLWFGSASGSPDHRTPQGKQNSFEINYIRAWRFK